MEPAAAASPAAEPASLIVTDPGGHRTRVPIAPLPFLIGRQPQSNLILRDSRVSRTHARIVFEHGGYVLADTGSRHGIFVNGQRIERQPLANSDRIDFGAQDSYQLLFMMDGAELRRLMEQVAAPEATPGAPGLGGGLARLRAVLDLARTLQGSFSLEDLLGPDGGAGGRHDRRARPGRRPGQAARRARPGAHAARLVLARGRAGPGGGYRAGRHPLRTRL